MKVLIGDYPEDGSERQIEVEIHNQDIWNLDFTLANIILPALIKFRSNLNSYPGEFAEVQEDGVDGSVGGGIKKWEEILDHMIWSFTCVVTDDDYYHYYENHGKSWVGYTEHLAKVDEGLMLFGKYFRNLWD